MPRPSFWDLNEAYKCVQEGDSLINKLRKPELVRALSALAWYARTIPNAPELLLEVRALAGRITDGLDKPGTDDYVDHPWRALMGQKGLTPFSYTTSLKQAGIPQAPPPLPGHAPAYSYVPDPDPGAGAGTVAAGTGQLAAPEEAEDPATQTVAKQGEEEEDIFSNLGTLTIPAGVGGDSGVGDSGGSNPNGNGKVSDHSSCSITSLAAPPRQLAKAGVVGDDGLVDEGTNVAGVAGVDRDGGTSAGGGNVTSQKAPKATSTMVWRPRVCNRVWKGKQCPNRSNGCRFAHPTPCNNDRCKPGPAPGCRAFHPAVSKKGPPVSKGDPGKKGNAKGSVRKGGGAPKGKGPNAGRIGGTSGGGRGSSGSNGHSSSNHHSNNNSRPRPNGLQLRERLEMMERRLGLQGDDGGRMPSYRDVAASSLNDNSSAWWVRAAGNPERRDEGCAHARAQLPPGLMDAVMAAVMAVVADGGQRLQAQAVQGQRPYRC